MLMELNEKEVYHDSEERRIKCLGNSKFRRSLQKL